MPKLDGILETVVHTKDMASARAFYESVLGLALIYSDDRLSAYAVADRDVLLVFRKGAAAQTVTLPSGTIPGHGGDGALHVAFAISNRCQPGSGGAERAKEGATGSARRLTQESAEGSGGRGPQRRSRLPGQHSAASRTASRLARSKSKSRRCQPLARSC